MTDQTNSTESQTGAPPAGPNGNAPAQTVEEQIAALLAGGNLSDLATLTQLKNLVDSRTQALRAEERQKSEKVKAEVRGQLVGSINQQMLDAVNAILPDDFLAKAKDAGLLGITITFPVGENGAITLQQSAAAVSKPAAERKTAPDGSTAVKTPAGQSNEPGDEATYNLETDEAMRQEDNAEIERQLAEATAKGRNPTSAKNSITWKIRHDRIKTVRTGNAVGHLRAPVTA